MYIKYNPNPIGRHVEDCSVRALSKALDIDWEIAYDLLADAGYQMADMPHSNVAMAGVLRRRGFYRAVIPNTCPDCYTAEDFCMDHPYGVFVLVFNGHVAAVVDGDLYDSWDSSKEIPQFYWYKKG